MLEIILRPYQENAVGSILQYFINGGKGNPLVVAPTGSGKSVIIGKFAERVLKTWPNQKIIALAHRKELLQQNYTKLLQIWPEAPAGVYSAGLRSRVLHKNITIAGIASIFKKAPALGWQDLLLVDEAHLLPPDGEGMYQQLIAGLKRVNKNLKVIGFTATPFRLKTGMLIEPGGVFTDIAYDIEVAMLVREGYLAPLISKVPKTQANLDGVHIRGGEYVAAEMEAVMDTQDLTAAAIKEMDTYLVGRKSCIVFCAGVAHAENITEALRRAGHTAECVTGETDPLFRASILNSFKQGLIRFLVNCDVLTTGFDSPNVDAIILLRPTQSAGLYIQMCGRGMRLSPETGKLNCIVLDFAGNIERHGPIDAIKVRRKSAGDGSGDEVNGAPVKVCPQCRNGLVPISVMRCPECGYIFPAPPKHEAQASVQDVMTIKYKPPTKWIVTHTEYAKHEKSDSPPSVRVTYTVEQEGVTGNLAFKKIKEWVCIEHFKKFPYQKAIEWWLLHHNLYKTPERITIPKTSDEMLARIKELRPVATMFVQKDGEWERIISSTFGEYVPPIEGPVLSGFEKFADFDPKAFESVVAATKPEPSIYDDDDIPF